MCCPYWERRVWGGLPHGRWDVPDSGIQSMFCGWIIFVVAHYVIYYCFSCSLYFKSIQEELDGCGKGWALEVWGLVCKSSEDISNLSKMTIVPVTPLSHTGALNSQKDRMHSRLFEKSVFHLHVWWRVGAAAGLCGLCVCMLLESRQGLRLGGGWFCVLIIYGESLGRDCYIIFVLVLSNILLKLCYMFV